MVDPVFLINKTLYNKITNNVIRQSFKHTIAMMVHHYVIKKK